MAQNIIDTNIREAYDTEANWIKYNPVLLSGQLAYSSDKYGKYKIGNGASRWSQLQYATLGWGDITEKPSTFSPSTHTHPVNQVTGLTPSAIGAAASGHTHSQYAPTSHNHSADNITSGVLPISRGGTGANNYQTALRNLVINGAVSGTATPTDSNWYLCSDRSDSTETPVKRSMSSLWNYIKGKTDANYLKLTGGKLTGRLQPSQGQFVHSAHGASGKQGYVKVAQLKIAYDYQNTPIEITFARRSDRTPTKLSILFASIETNDPTLENFTYMGSSNTAWMYKSATSTWDLYIQKSEAYDNVGILQYYHPQQDAGINIVWTDAFATQLPSGTVQATISKGYKVGYAESSSKAESSTNSTYLKDFKDGHNIAVSYAETEVKTCAYIPVYSGRDKIVTISPANLRNTIGAAPASHTHPYAPTSHTHTIANITGLQGALDGKAASNHAHSNYATTTNLNLANQRIDAHEKELGTHKTLIDGKAPSNHSHSSINDWTSGTALSISTSTHVTPEKAGDYDVVIANTNAFGDYRLVTMSKVNLENQISDLTLGRITINAISNAQIDSLKNL